MSLFSARGNEWSSAKVKVGDKANGEFQEASKRCLLGRCLAKNVNSGNLGRCNVSKLMNKLDKGAHTVPKPFRSSISEVV